MSADFFFDVVLHLLPVILLLVCLLLLVVVDARMRDSRMIEVGEIVCGLRFPRRKAGERRIVCAANRFRDGTLLLGVRHWDTHMTLHAYCYERAGATLADDDPEQGFLDNRGEFVTRAQAWEIAKNAGQIQITDGTKVGQLYSENLY